LRSSVISAHLHMQLTYCSVKWNVSELLIHVVNASSGLISEDDAESFDVIGSSFEDLINWQNLSLSALGLELSSQMIPEFGFSDDIISCE
jgi:hypothetical protein